MSDAYRWQWALPPGHIDAIAGALFARRPYDTLEWGSGTSTRLLRDVCGLWGGRVVSIDSDPDHAAPGALILPERDEYVGWPTLHVPQGGWDFVFVDGRWRSRCLRAIRPHLSPLAIVVLHDAEREYYHEAVDELGGARLALPALDGTGRELWIIRPGP